MLTTPPLQHLALPDGRVLSYVEYGNPDGQPLLYAHGSPGSHVDWLLADPDGTLATSHNLRVLAPNRPGFSESTFQAGRQVTDWPQDIAFFTDSLGIDHFEVVAVSGGAPYAVALAHAFPDRIQHVDIICGVGPLDVPGLTRNMGISKQIFRLSRWLPILVQLQYGLIKRGLQNNPQQVVRQALSTLALPDQKLLAEPVMQQVFLSTMSEALRQGTRGLTYDNGLFARRWNMVLETIQVPFDLWYGTADRNVTLEMGRYLESALPQARLHLLEGEGHFSTGVRALPQALALRRA